MDASKSNPSQQEIKLHFLDYWRIIRVRKTVILVVFLIVLLSATAITLLLPKTYSSMARMEVNKEASDIDQLFGSNMPQQFDPFFIETEFQRIQSTSMLYPVIEELGLQRSWAKKLNIPGELPIRQTYLMLLRQLNLSQTRNTSLIEVNVESRDPEEAAIIANKIAEIYKDSRLDQQLDAAERGIQTLITEREAQEEKIRAQQREVDKLSKDLQVSDLTAEGTSQTLTSGPAIIQRQEMSRAEAIQQLVSAKARLELLQKMPENELKNTITFLVPDQLLNSLLSAEALAEQRLVTMTQDKEMEHPDVLSVMALLTKVRSQISEQINGILRSLETEVASTEKQVEKIEEEVERIKTKERETTEKFRPYFLAKRELESMQRMRDSLLAKITFEQIDSKIPKSNLVVITDPAEKSVRPIRPSVTLNIGLGIIVGLAAGIGLAFFIEYLDTSVKTIDDVEQALGAPVLAVIPQNVGSLIDEGPESPHAEAYRVLRTNITFALKDPKHNTFTVVSAGAGEGKTTTLFNLAVIFAQGGDRVLVVDSDLRRPSLHRLFKVSNSLGLTNYLLKQNKIEEVIQTSHVPNMDFLPSGRLPSSSMGILNSTQMKALIIELKKRYDYIFFDSPPIMGVSDASILASEVDMAIQIIQYRKYPQALTIRAKQMVDKVKGNLLGVVLNNINISQDENYYYYGGYYYDYYYSKNDKEDGEGGSKSSKKSGSGRSSSNKKSRINASEPGKDKDSEDGDGDLGVKGKY